MLCEVLMRTYSNRYYEFNDSVAREILGKKLTSKNRKDMEEVAEKTGISLKSCRRQFNNVKRVFKTVEDLPGSLVTNINQHFLLPEELAKYVDNFSLGFATDDIF